MTETLSEQLADYRAGWRARVPADKQTLMDRHVAHLASSTPGRMPGVISLAAFSPLAPRCRSLLREPASSTG